MHNKKNSEPEKTPEQEALERRVDAMMDPKRLDEAPAGNSPPPAAKDTKTAPQLSTKLRKQIGAANVPTAPLSIDKLDELTESIAGPDAAAEQEPEKNDLDDNQTEKAVDDIVAHEGDVMLAVEDATAAERNRKITEASGQKGESRPFATFIWILVIIIVIVAIVFFGFLLTGGNLPKLPKL